MIPFKREELDQILYTHPVSGMTIRANEKGVSLLSKSIHMCSDEKDVEVLINVLVSAMDDMQRYRKEAVEDAKRSA